MNNIPGTLKKEGCYCIWVKGTVQGVGFRPFVYRLASSLHLRGVVFNCAEGVCIEVEGGSEKVEILLQAIKNNHPPLARIKEITFKELPFVGYRGFTIKESGNSKGEREGLLPPDSALCRDCACDIENPFGRFFLYPFTNCINCGPRFTISRKLPYDRRSTSMNAFSLCASCNNEFSNPLNRRFHAQPICCPLCGPHITLLDNKGRLLIEESFLPASYTEVIKEGERIASRTINFSSSIQRGSWREAVWEVLTNGALVAVKSLGGFHLICNATNANAVRELRRRKGRGSKPFAVMFRDLNAVEKYCLIDKTEREMLKSSEAPIVLLHRKNNLTDMDLPAELAPNLKTLGVMLPFTPLHKMLLSGALEVMVMTSGNYSDLPLVKDNECALTELSPLADYFLMHNRDIINRCDDSVVVVIDGNLQFVRRSRGYVPSPVRVPGQDPTLREIGIKVLSPPGNVNDVCKERFRAKRSTVVFGSGGDMKSTFCILRGCEAFLSQHLGNLNNVESTDSYRESLNNFQTLLGVTAEIIGYDLHPDYLSSRMAANLPGEHIPVQHHHAHLASCLAENCYEDEAIGVILDGTGYGTDGNLWGFEILTGSFKSFQRHCHLAYMPLPGGDEAIRKPWMTAVAALIYFCGKWGECALEILFPNKKVEAEIITRLIRTKSMSLPLSCGCGRLFDIVSALTGICIVNSYEGQAAVELGELVIHLAEDTVTAADESSILTHSYPFSIRGRLIDPTEIFTGIINDLYNGHSREEIALRFHHTVTRIVVEAVSLTAQKTGLSTVALSGGCWHNRYLFLTTRNLLRARGFKVLYHRRVPPNDGGISLGQAMIARALWGVNK